MVREGWMHVPTEELASYRMSTALNLFLDESRQHIDIKILRSIKTRFARLRQPHRGTGSKYPAEVKHEKSSKEGHGGHTCCPAVIKLSDPSLLCSATGAEN